MLRPGSEAPETVSPTPSLSIGKRPHRAHRRSGATPKAPHPAQARHIDLEHREAAQTATRRREGNLGATADPGGVRAPHGARIGPPWWEPACQLSTLRNLNPPYVRLGVVTSHTLLAIIKAAHDITFLADCAATRDYAHVGGRRSPLYRVGRRQG